MYTLPNAKINIGLKVVGRRQDGYHDLQTVFYPISLSDSLEVTALKNEDRPFELLVNGITFQGEDKDNLVVKVYLALKEEFELPPVRIYLTKHIPVGAGLGGGSSDAANMMKLLNDMFSLGLSDKEMEARLSPFGADCPFFIHNKPVYAEEIGDKFSPVSLSLKGYHLLLVKPDINISTALAYRGVRPEMPSVDLKTLITQTPFHLWRDVIVNDFEESIFPNHPEIAAIKQTLYDMGAIYASMSGSGSSVYGVFSRPIDDVSKLFPDCFTFTGTLG